jgi:hypothetical protein
VDAFANESLTIVQLERYSALKSKQAAVMEGAEVVKLLPIGYKIIETNV